MTSRGETVRHLYDQLRHLLIEGYYRPGERLSQERLIADLSAGRTPLREALRMLEADGLVHAETNRGITVSEAPLRAAEEYYAIRVLLEPPLLSVAMSTLTPSNLAEMERHLDAMGRSADRQKDFQKAHLKFHLVDVNRYGNKALQDIVVGLYQRIHRHQQVYMSRPRVPEDFLALDRMLLQAVRAGDGEWAKRTLQFHLLDAAIGLILDVEPDHRFGPLPAAVAASGMELVVRPDRRIARPAPLRWVDSSVVSVMPGLQTSNLCYEPMQDGRAQQRRAAPASGAPRHASVRARAPKR